MSDQQQKEQRSSEKESVVQALMKVQPRSHYTSPGKPSVSWLAKRARLIREIRSL